MSTVDSFLFIFKEKQQLFDRRAKAFAAFVKCLPPIFNYLNGQGIRIEAGDDAASFKLLGKDYRLAFHPDLMEKVRFRTGLECRVPGANGEPRWETRGVLFMDTNATIYSDNSPSAKSFTKADDPDRAMQVLLRMLVLEFSPRPQQKVA